MSAKEVSDIVESADDVKEALTPLASDHDHKLIKRIIRFKTKRDEWLKKLEVERREVERLQLIAYK